MDIAVHVGTLHYTCKAVIDTFKDDMPPGDVFMINDPLRRPAPHFNDVRIIRPVFVGVEINRLRPVQRALVRCRRQHARLLRRAGQGDVPRRHPHHADAADRRGQVAPRLRQHDRRQHARPGIDHRRHERAGRGHPRRRARDAAAGGQVRQGHRRHRLQGGAGLCRAGDAPAHRRAPRRHLGERRLYRPGSGERRRADSDQGQAHHRGRRGHLRLHRQPRHHQLALQLGLRRHLLGRRRGHEDLLPRPAAQLGLLPADQRDRARELHRGRPLAGRGDRLPDAVREDHELDL